ncbi:TIGR02281 family clan AA aspartic protease [Simiduia curdlanivorans]|uniref:TIGR02281 family clan AA aspartic protease n=1 Tax=Simiduia curdlanivorans TaxID=1492769 RepID=A0ABV8V3E9_9GAMM|nr:TIGR02281 family clan AA aspartic protease [Simiduia curdlanivorans]MDN3637598.1 TIGR02281 family clan AA aspartic protease [Simiduia curdlanivorans]
MIRLFLLCISLSLPSALMASGKVDIQVSALFKGSALLDINGKRQLLKVGATSPEGVQVIAANSKSVVISYRGQQQELTLNRKIGALFAAPEKALVRINTGKGGHYWAKGQINGRPVDMLVDTGATSVAMSERHAQSLGLQYRQGLVGMATTAGGKIKSWQVNLDSVSVGNVLVNQVSAVVLAGDFPEMVLLGNSFLDKVDIDREQGVLVIRSRF